MLQKHVHIDFLQDAVHYKSAAYTLRPEEIGTHESGWTIEGVIHEDWYEWVNYFEAHHPVYGVVKGDYEKMIEAECEEGFRHFVEHHPAYCWDYHDI